MIYYPFNILLDMFFYYFIAMFSCIFTENIFLQCPFIVTFVYKMLGASDVMMGKPQSFPSSSLSFGLFPGKTGSWVTSVCT